MSTPAQVIAQKNAQASGHKYAFPDDLASTNNAHYISMQFYDEIRGRVTKPVVKDPSLMVYLPIPAAVGNNFTANYNNVSLSLFGEIARRTGESVMNNGSTVMGVVNGLKIAMDQSKALAGQFGFNALSTTALGTDALSGANLALKSYVAQQFTNMGLREFGMQWRLVARSAAESETIRAIENKIKLNMHPTINTADDDYGGGLVNYPARVVVRFMSGDKENEHYPRYMPCVVTSFSVTYNPTVMSMHESTNAPVEVEFGISFREIVMLTREDFLADSTDNTTTPDLNKGVR